MLGQFQTTSFNYRNGKTVAAATTLTATDEYIKVNGAYTMTLPSITALIQAGVGGKAYKIENLANSTVTISCNALDTIEDGSTAGTTSIYLYADDDYVILVADPGKLQWRRDYAKPAIDAAQYLKDGSITGQKIKGGKGYFAVTVNTNGTTAVNVFSSAGAPYAMTVTGISAVAKDTIAGNITLTNGTSGVSTFAKSATAGIVTGEDGALTYYSVTAADTLTIISSSTGEARVTITYTVP